MKRHVTRSIDEEACDTHQGELCPCDHSAPDYNSNFPEYAATACVAGGGVGC